MRTYNSWDNPIVATIEIRLDGRFNGYANGNSIVWGDLSQHDREEAWNFISELWKAAIR